CESPQLSDRSDDLSGDRRVRSESGGVHSCCRGTTMRILAVHNRYSSRVPSGENLAVDDELRWLTDAGVEVVRHEVTNDALVAPGPLGRVRDGVEAMWSL